MSPRWTRWAVAVVLVAAPACSGSDDATDTGGALAGTVTSDRPQTSTPSLTAVASLPASEATGRSGSVPMGTPEPADTTVPAAAGVQPDGFDLLAGRVTAADGGVCDVCLWLAATSEQRGRGLMGVTDLGLGDGMLFRWDEPTTGNFWMRDTPQPLSIAFYAADGSFVSATDMEPCLQPTPDAECPRYAAAGTYTYAVEVFAGGLPPLLMGPGSRLEVLEGACPDTT